MAKYLGYNGTHAGATICAIADNDTEKNYIEGKHSSINWVTASDSDYEKALKEQTTFYWDGSASLSNTYNDGTSWDTATINSVSTLKVNKDYVKDWIDVTVERIDHVLKTYTDLPNSSAWTSTKTALEGFDIDAQTWTDNKSDIAATNAYDYLTKKGLSIKSPLQLV